MEFVTTVGKELVAEKLAPSLELKLHIGLTTLN